MPRLAISSIIACRVSFALILAFAWGCDSSKPPEGDAAKTDPAAPAPADDRSIRAEDDEARSESTAGEQASGTDREVPPGADPLVPTGITRNSTEGWWRIVFSVNSNDDYPQDYSAGFIKISKTADGAYGVDELRTNDIINPAKPIQQEATDKTVNIAFAFEDTRFDYAGSLDGNVVRGNLQFESSRQNLVRLVPVAESDVTDEALDRQRLGATFGSAEIVNALQSESPVEQLRAAAKTWRTSPVLYLGYDALFQSAAGLGIDRPTLEQLANEFEAVGRLWGERAEQAAKLNTAIDLLLTGYETELADQKLEQVRQDAPQLASRWDELIATVRERGEAVKARRERVAAIATAREHIEQGQTDQGLETLRRLHAEEPVDLVATYRLAVAERDHGSKDEALRLFARLAVLPQAELELGDIPGEEDYMPSHATAERLYEEQHGNRDGFDDYLSDVYHDAITSFLTEEDRSRAPTDSARTVLVELFTGAMCPPCVAADVATEAVEHSFPGSDVVVLRYHVHHPGPDPLASADSLARHAYYGTDIQGTPTILIDGMAVAYNVGGPYSNSPVVYGDLAETIAAQATKPPQGEIELSAAVETNVLRITAGASAAQPSPESLRLRLAVVEIGVDFVAYNGIRSHEMVVREMPGGAAGIAAVEGTFAFEQEIPLVELRERVLDFLDQSESQLSREYGQPFAFDERPLVLGRLKVVAFLQDDATREVLQAAVVPIETEIELPPLEREQSDDPEPAGTSADGTQPKEGPALSLPDQVLPEQE